MRQEDVDFKKIPDTPGVYLFRDPLDRVLYVGRATDLRSRVRSYFSDRLAEDRGARIADALEKAKRVEVIPTDSVLEAYIMEAGHIKALRPAYNVVNKDDTSFQFVVITREDFPRVLILRGRDLDRGVPGVTPAFTFGPFPRGSLLKESLRVIRKIFPYRDFCRPHDPERGRAPKKCFRAQLGLCPGACAGLITKEEYRKRIREIRMFFSGKKKRLVRLLEKEMARLAREREFERAAEVRNRIFALTHIQDVALIKKEVAESVAGSKGPFRVEAYDVAHLGGKQSVGAMTVLVDGDPVPAEYRLFTIRHAAAGDDVGASREILERRFQHPEWRFPNLIVVDGGKAQLRAAESVLSENGLRIPVVSVVKTDRHAPREILGSPAHARAHERSIISANAEAHRFALGRHRRKRSDALFGDPS